MLTIKYLQSGGLVANYYCSSRCRHCLYRCSPAWPKDYIDKETAIENLKTISKLGCRAVHIGGGEPFLNFDGLCQVVEAARETRVAIDYIETNSSWFKDMDSAVEKLKVLRRLGVSTLLVSISPFHNEYVPAKKVRSVVQACRKSGMNVFPWIEDFWPEVSTLDEGRRHSFQEYEDAFGKDYIRQLPNRYWISPGGRALDFIRDIAPLKQVNTILSENNDACAELEYTGHFHIDLYENYVPGLCAGLAIHRDDLGAPLSEAKYPLLTLLHTGGVNRLYEMAVHDYNFTANGKGYTNKCDLCFEIRKFLFDNASGFHELAPAPHYWDGENPAEQNK